MSDYIPEERSREGGHPGQIIKRESLGLLARGQGPPEPPPLLGRLLGNPVWVQGPVALGVSGGKNKSRPLRLTPCIDLAWGPGQRRGYPVIPSLPPRSRDPPIFFVCEGLSLQGSRPYFLRGSAPNGDLLVPLGPNLAPFPRGVGGDGRGQEVALVPPVLLPGPGQLPVPVRLRGPDLGLAMHFAVLLVRRNGQGHAHPDGGRCTPPPVWLLIVLGDAGSSQEPILSPPGAVPLPPQGVVSSWAS